MILWLIAMSDCDSVLVNKKGKITIEKKISNGKIGPYMPYQSFGQLTHTVPVPIILVKSTMVQSTGLVYNTIEF